MSPLRRKPSLFLILLPLALFAATAWAAERTPARSSAGFTPRYGVVAEMELELMLGRHQVVDPATGRIYALDYYKTELNIIDTQPALQDTTFALPFRTGLLVLNLDGSRLYVLEEPATYADEGRIAVLDTATLTIVDNFLFICSEDEIYCRVNTAAVGPGNRLYLPGYLATIDIYDGATGERLLSFTHPGDAPTTFAIHGATLYTVTNSISTLTSTVRRFDISALTPVVGPSRELAGYSYDSLQIAPDGSFLLLHEGITGGRTLQLDTTSLNTIRSFEVEEDAYYAQAIASSNSEEIILRWGYWPEEVNHSIEARDATTGTLRRIGYWANNPNFNSDIGLLPLPNNEIAYLFVNGIQILHPNDYAATAPVVMANYCGGPFVDTFNDPASGWPIADLGPVAFRYHNDQYSILQRESERWSAVSRGDVWDNWQGAGIRTWVPTGEGISGLVFGLNDDWSQFYTLEVIPHLRRWVVFHYSDAGGWELLATGLGTNGIDQTNSLVLDKAGDGTLELHVNDVTVFRLWSPPAGRVGLSGGSFEGQVDLRFEDYMIVTGPNCFRDNVRAGAPDRSPAIPRPPLDEILE